MFMKSSVFLGVGLFLFFLCTSIRDPIACSILGGGIPTQNSGYKRTRLCPSYVYRMLCCTLR